MKADFSGYATKAGLECADGLTIVAHAFQKQDKTRVPLVWQHGHNDVKNILGHAILENRDDGVYTYGFFNDSPEAQHAAGLLKHGDINAMSIWANQLVKQGQSVVHGVIREVSLVLSGANPGALIESVTIQHDGYSEESETEGIIHTGLTLEYTNADEDDSEDDSEDADEDDSEVAEDADEDADEDDSEDFISIEHMDLDDDDELTVKDVYDSMSSEQKQVLHFMLGKASSSDKLEQSDIDETDDHVEHTNNQEGSNNMSNVFDQTGSKADETNTLSHSQLNEIIGMAQKSGSLQGAITDYGAQHGIENIEVMFPDAQAVSAQPDWVKRRTEWVSSFLTATKKSPFSKIKSLSADITEDDARAKGYITGTLKREEYFKVARRVTEPTTVYKKQKLERDDMIDITEYNVVAWLQAEMRMMLEEEIARAALLGDGRDASSEDKINEGNIRPIVSDNELYTTVVKVNVFDADSTADEIIDAVIMNRSKYKGTGTPNFYTTETQIAKFLMVKDGFGRRIYQNISEVAQILRVASIVPVEVMEEYPEIIGVIVNPVDYTMGANKGGEVTMFDDFDIDYNQMKYLIETRLCGALTKPKSAMVVKSVAAEAVLVVPESPLFDAQTGALTVNDTTGVVYKDVDGVVINNAGSPYTVASGETYLVFAEPAGSGFYFSDSDADDFSFTAD